MELQDARRTGSANWRLVTILRDAISKISSRIPPWILCVTEHKTKPAPVLIIKEWSSSNGEAGANSKPAGRTYLKDQGLLYSRSLRRCLPVVRTITGRVCNDAGIPLELHKYFLHEHIAFRGTMPLDEEAGTKLALIFKLQERVKDMERVELIARRVERFSREEAVYWLTRATQYGAAANRWALAGMRVILGGRPEDRTIARRMLEKLRR